MYKLARNNVTKAIRTAKADYYNTIIKENSKDVWRAIKKILPSKGSSDIGSLEVDGKEISDIDSITLNFNQFLGSKLAEKFDPVDPKTLEIKTVSDAKFTFKPATWQEVQKLLNKLQTKKAHGLDNIPCRLLKTAAPKIALPLSIIFNQSLQSGTLPTSSNVLR